MKKTKNITSIQGILNFGEEENNSKQDCLNIKRKSFIGNKSIKTTNSELVCGLVDPLDSEYYTINTNTRLKWRCLLCGNEFYKLPITISSRGIYCDSCSDKYSMPNKCFFNFLKETGIYFEIEKKFKWSTFTDGRYFRYDFFIPSINTIFEIMGAQHYPRNNKKYYGRTYEEIHEIDLQKENLAILNGIDQYIKVDCRETYFEYMKNSIICSVENIFSLKNIDWNVIEKNLSKSIIREVCFLYESNPTLLMNDIIFKTKLSSTTIRDYLKRGAKMGLCSYDPKSGLRRRDEKRHEHHKSLIKENYKNICECYNKVHCETKIKDLYPEFGWQFIRDCLIFGNKIGLCNYNEDAKMLLKKTFTKEAISSRSSKILKKDLDGNIIKEYPSLRRASLENGIYKKRLSELAMSKEAVSGFIFEYEDGRTQPIKCKNHSAKPKSVSCFNLENDFIFGYGSIGEAAKETGISTSCISHCISGNQNTAGGYIWRYNTTPDNTVNFKNNHKLPVDCYNLSGKFIKTYDSTVDAAIELNGCASAITNALKGKTKNSYGYIWKYKNKEE